MTENPLTPKPLDIFPHASDSLAAPADSNRVYEAIVEMVHRVLRVERCTLMTVDNNAGVLQMKCGSGMSLEVSLTHQTKLGVGVAGSVAATGQPLLIQDVRQSPFYDPERADQYSSDSFICLPIWRHGEVIGVLSVTNRAGGSVFTEEDMAQMNALTGFISMALENADLLDRSQGLEELLRDLLDSLVVGVVALDADWRVTSWNHGAEALLSIPAAKAMKRKIFDLMPPAIWDKLRQEIQTTEEGHSAHCADIEWPRPGSDGNSIPLVITLTRLRRRRESQGGVMMVLEDLTLNREFAALKRVDDLKTNFIAMISHELRTPLTSMRGSIQLLTTMLAETVDETSKQLLSILNCNTERLIHHVNSLLEVTQLQNNSILMRRDSCDLCAIADRCIADMRDIADRRKITLSVHCLDRPIMVYADEDKIERVILHLLENAIKYSPIGSAVETHVEPLCDAARLLVKDTGSGIDKEHALRIFDPFTQIGPGITRGSTGVGLGLYIVREFTRLHQGKIEILSTGLQGTTFALTLPRPSAIEAGANERR